MGICCNSLSKRTDEKEAQLNSNTEYKPNNKDTTHYYHNLPFVEQDEIFEIEAKNIRSHNDQVNVFS